MQRFDRILGILLFLRSGQIVSASELARHFAISTRTVYRDLETLSLLGVPLYAERGREGGFQLLEGYFLPPLMFTQNEAVAVLLGLALQKNLRVTPFPTEALMAEKKLLAALPERLRAVLTKTENIIGVEKLPEDIFHPETGFTTRKEPEDNVVLNESDIISTFFQAILEGKQVAFQYPSRRTQQGYEIQISPYGLFWDRNHWYLVGRPSNRSEAWTWRSDRIIDIRPLKHGGTTLDEFDIRKMLGRSWLKDAITQWSQQAPVKILLFPRQAERLQQDWYYRHARFEQLENGQIMMTFGESDATIVLELLRWLGPEAELIEPREWRAKVREDLQQMLVKYVSDHQS
jgi:predicted DNA-binding transcriptional regulator YafY